jgi:hypothetical protein
MRNYPITLLFVGLAGLVLLAACEGFFPMGDFEPSGTPFYLATGITAEVITGKDAGFPDTGVYPLKVVLSSSSGTLTDELPAGLLFRSTQNQVQHMLVLKDHAVTATEAGTANEVGVFCCNELRHIPRSGDTFELGPVTDNAGLQEIASLVRDKDISGALWTVQRAVWMVTDSTGLNSFYRDSLAALPDETDGPAAGHRYDRRELEREKLLWRELKSRDR